MPLIIDKYNKLYKDFGVFIYTYIMLGGAYGIQEARNSRLEVKCRKSCVCVIHAQRPVYQASKGQSDKIRNL